MLHGSDVAQKFQMKNGASATDPAFWSLYPLEVYYNGGSHALFVSNFMQNFHLQIYMTEA